MSRIFRIAAAVVLLLSASFVVSNVTASAEPGDDCPDGWTETTLTQIDANIGGAEAQGCVPTDVGALGADWSELCPSNVNASATRNSANVAESYLSEAEYLNGTGCVPAACPQGYESVSGNTYPTLAEFADNPDDPAGCVELPPAPTPPFPASDPCHWTTDAFVVDDVNCPANFDNGVIASGEDAGSPFAVVEDCQTAATERIGWNPLQDWGTAQCWVFAAVSTETQPDLDCADDTQASLLAYSGWGGVGTYMQLYNGACLTVPGPGPDPTPGPTPGPNPGPVPNPDNPSDPTNPTDPGTSSGVPTPRPAPGSADLPPTFPPAEHAG